MYADPLSAFIARYTKALVIFQIRPILSGIIVPILQGYTLLCCRGFLCTRGSALKVSTAYQDLPGLLMQCPDIYCRCIQMISVLYTTEL